MKAGILKYKEKLLIVLHFLLLIAVICCIPVLSKGQCIASSTNNGSVVSNDNAIGTLSFLNTGDVLTSDNNRTTATALVSFFSGSSHYLKVTGFGFSIPSYASICGVVVEIEKRATGISLGAWIRDNEVKIIKGNTITGNNMGFTGANWTGTDTYYAHGAANDLWGTTLTPVDVNAADFGVAISTSFNGLLGIFPSSQIDHIRMTIHYNPILPTHLLSFTSAIKNNSVLLKWTTADEEDNEVITLQKTITGSAQWTDIARFEMQTGNSVKEYSYTDMLNEKGNYSYRLKITNTTLQHTYSVIKNIQYAGSDFVTAYPNPASNYITISNLSGVNNISIRNIYQQQYKATYQITANGCVTIDISHLPGGVYFADLGTKQVKFLKQ